MLLHHCHSITLLVNFCPPYLLTEKQFLEMSSGGKIIHQKVPEVTSHRINLFGSVLVNNNTIKNLSCSQKFQDEKHVSY